MPSVRQSTEDIPMTTMAVAGIDDVLAQIEREEQVRICLAVESGSRAWGFPSTDSDYDVRFIYVHTPEWYLSIEDGRDVIERPLIGLVDASGWDLRKALRLFRKSNPPLIEWLQSPFVYLERFEVAAELRQRLPRFFSPEAGYYHYLHMARGNFREYLRGDSVWRKKYLYVLRPLLAMRWIESGRGAVPIEFSRLVDVIVDDPELRGAIDDLVEMKRTGNELDEGPPIPRLSAFIEHELKRVEAVALNRREGAPPVAELDAVFRTTLNRAWADKSPA